MWNFFSRRTNSLSAFKSGAKKGVFFFAFSLCAGGFPAVQAGEILKLSVETAEVRARPLASVADSEHSEHSEHSEYSGHSAPPSLHENFLNEMGEMDGASIYALSPAAIHLRLPRMFSPRVFEADTSFRGVFGASGANPAAHKTAFPADGTWSGFIDRAAREFDVDPVLIAAVIRAESAFYAQAVSKKGARGLMQLMPETGRAMGLTDPFDPDANIRAGTRYLKAQLDRFGTVEKALAAYNAGPGNILKHDGVPPFAETREFVRRVLGYWQAARSSATGNRYSVHAGKTRKAGTGK